jgi:hypothetical protein
VLLVDAHTTPCYHPKAPFDEAKIYFDRKNRIYGLKTEVAMSVQAPHYCTHVSNSVPGSVHNLELFKQGYERYLPYLLKLPAKHMALVGDQNNCYWALLCDKGYISPDDASPDVHWICPVKNPQSHNDCIMNNLKAHKNMMIECFFGRLLGLFNIFQACYQWSHSHFDDDLLICCGLTNEIISTLALSEMDYCLYQAMLEKRVQEYEEKKRKRKQEQDSYQDQRQRCLTFGE